MAATRQEIQQFLNTAQLTGYQRIKLPYGLEIPGRDQQIKANAIFKDTLKGKSVLDIGCYYGFYAHEAKKKGADKVVGLELNFERAAIAAKISEFIGDGVEIINGDIMTIELESKFDLVLFLSVLHHIRDPITLMRRLANLCSGTLVVEFCLPTHRLKRKGHNQGTSLSLQNKLSTFYRQKLLKLLDERVGIVVSGEVFGENENEFDWTFFFNKKAFRTIFQVHNKLFSGIQFIPSPLKQNRMLAFCQVEKTSS